MFISQNIRFRPIFNDAFLCQGKTAVFPWGFYSKAPSDVNGVALTLEDGDVIVGHKISERALSEGEVEIFSKGGASIILKNNGSVIINGLLITKNGTIPSLSTGGGSGGGSSDDGEDDNGSIFE